MQLDTLETPSLLIDLDQMQANIQRVQSRMDALGFDFRPHTKTHKIPEIARMQVDAGAVGIACQKVSEAEIFAAAGFNDIQLPYNIVGAAKTAKLADLALYNRITVTADHLSVIAGLADAAKTLGIVIRVLVELATDIQRTGASVDEVVTLAQRIDAEEHLHFAGIMAYPSTPKSRPIVQEALHRLNSAGIGVDIVSGGGIAALTHADELEEFTELRIGTYVFGDWTTVTKGIYTPEQCALKIAATVVSRPTSERAILDSGSKTLTSDRLKYGEGVMFGHIVEYPDAHIYALNEEHAYVDVSRCDSPPVIGERVHVIPVHVCTSVNLHERVYGVRGDSIETVWEVAARGRVW